MAPLIILMYALFATSFSISKYLLSLTNPTFLMAIRFTIAGLILVIYQFFFTENRLHIRKKSHYFLLFQIIIFGIYLSYILRFWGLQYLSSFKTAVLFNSSPFFASLYSYLFFQETMSKKQWFGLIIGFFGLIPILITSSPSEHALGELLFISWPEIAVLTAVAVQGYGWIIVRHLVRGRSYDITLVNGITMFIGGLLGFATLPITGSSIEIDKPIQFFGWLGIIILTSNIICHNLYSHLLKSYSITFLSFAGFLVPIFAAFYGWAFLGEQITWHFYASTIIVFFGLYIFYLDELKKKPQYFA